MSNYKPPYTITSRMLSLSTQIGEELTKIECIKNTIITPLLRKKNRIKTIAGTLEIEGNFLGEDKITAILNGKKVLGTMIEVAEVEGAINAYKSLEKYKPYELDDLLKAHKILMNGILASAGNLRTVDVGVGTHVASPNKLVPELMINLFDWLKTSDEHPLIKSSIFHYEFEFIHPFSDGNGRIGRLWQSMILYNWKNIFNAIPIESIIRNNQEEYYNALEKSSALGESTPFIEFMLEVILRTINELQKENVPRNVPKNVPKKRADAIIDFIIKNQDITVMELADKLKVSDKTVKRDINKLKEAKLIKRAGSLKSGHWIIINRTA